MAGFRKPEVPREQLTLWSVKLDDAIAADHPVRQLDFLLHREPFAETFREWARDYVLVAGQPPYHPRDLTGLYLYGMLNRLRSSRVMPDKEGKSKPNYNAQMATDATAGVIVAEAVNDRAEDSGQLTPVLDEVRTEWSLLCTAVNVGILLRHGPEVMKVL
jgi:hypothetical protein